MTITPEIIAFVVAMAGIILPAMAIKIRKEKKNPKSQHQYHKKIKIIKSKNIYSPGVVNLV